MKDAKLEFLNYTKEYISLGDRVRLKINHTFRVMDLCEQIARSLKLKDEDINLAILCGLLHDIGRFEQYKRYQTFMDSKSIDHANLGVEILKNNNFLRRFNKDETNDELILNTVLYHNKYKISLELSEREKLFCNIIRDADKIDILYLYTISDIVINTYNEEFSPNIYKFLLNEKLISRDDKVTKADALAISLGFVFDINFGESFKILKEKNYLNEEIDIYQKKYTNEVFKEQLENIRKVINNYIDRRLV